MRYRVSLKKNWLCYLACGLMLLSAALRLGHFIPRWGETGWFMLATQLFVPLLANVVFCYGALKKGGYLITVLSVFLGVLFFIIKAQGFEHAWHTILCTLLYLLVFILYTITALGVVSSLLPQKLVFALPLAFHIAQDLFFPEPAFLAAPLPELSVLCIMGALLAATFALQQEPLKFEKNNHS